MDEATATKVPHTGSFFNSPPDCCLAVWGGAAPEPLICENARITNSTACRRTNVPTKMRMSRKTFRNMGRTQQVLAYFFFVGVFLAGADGFLYSVATCPSSIVIMPLADSA